MDPITEPLAPLLGSAFPPSGLTREQRALIAGLQRVLDAEIAPRAAGHDAKGRYPSDSVAALKRSGFLKAVVPAAFGGLGVPHRVSLEAQVRLGAAEFGARPDLQDPRRADPRDLRLCARRPAPAPRARRAGGERHSRPRGRRTRPQGRRSPDDDRAAAPRRRLPRQRDQDLHDRRRGSRSHRGLGVQPAGRRRRRESAARRAMQPRRRRHAGRDDPPRLGRARPARDRFGNDRLRQCRDRSRLAGEPAGRSLAAPRLAALPGGFRGGAGRASGSRRSARRRASFRPRAGRGRRRASTMRRTIPMCAGSSANSSPISRRPMR